MSVRGNTLLRNQILLCQQVFYYTGGFAEIQGLLLPALYISDSAPKYASQTGCDNQLSDEIFVLFHCFTKLISPRSKKSPAS